MRKIYILTIIVLITLMATACGQALMPAQVTATPAALPTISDDDRRATAHAVIMATRRAEATIEALTPTATPQPTATPSQPTPLPLPPIPEIDLNVDVPYLQDGGALPSGALVRIGIGDIHDVAIYPDRSAFLLGTSTGLYVYRLDTFERVWRRYLEHAPWDVSLSEDGRRIATGYGWESAPMLFEAQSGNRVSTLRGWHEAQWSPDSRFLAVEAVPSFDYEGDDPIIGQIRIFDSNSGELLRTVETPVDGFFGGVFSVIRWSPKGQHLAACGDEAIYVWDAATANLVHTIDANSTTGGLYLRYCGMAFSPDGEYLGIQDADNLFVVDMASGETVFESEEGAQGATWAPDHFYLAFESGIKVFDANTWTQVYQTDVPVGDFALSPSGQQVAFAGQNITILNSSSFDVEYTLPVSVEYVYWSPDGRWLVGYQDGEYILFDKEEAFASFKPQSRTIFIDDQSLLTFDENRVMLVGLPDGHVISGVRTGLNAKQLTWSQDGNTLVLSTVDGDWYWLEDDNQLTQDLPLAIEPGPITSVAESVWKRQETLGSKESPNGKWSVSTVMDSACGDGPWGGGCGIWSGSLSLTRTGETQPIATLEFPNSGPTVLAWSADSNLLAVGLGAAVDTVYDDRIVVIDVRAGDELFSFEGHLGDVTGLVFSPSGMRLASASEDGTVIVWNTGH